MSIKGNFSKQSAFNLDMALDECQDWIEKVLSVKFPSNFQESLKDGILLCKLINQIKPGSVSKINEKPSTDFAKRENLALFIKAAKTIGLRDTQLFESADLFESIRIRNVAISLYWLGRAAKALNFKGPQLDLMKFGISMNCSACKKPITNNDFLATMTQQFHTSCAVCCNCNCKLDPKKKFFQESNNFWCEPCKNDAGKSGVSPNNTGANKSGKSSNNNDDKCTGCFGSLEKGYVPDDLDKSKKYCTSCICDLCHEPLIGNFEIKNGKKICDGCSCNQCGKSLEDGYFEEGISKYCEPCAKDRIRPKSHVQKAEHCHAGDGHDHHSHKPTTTTTTTGSPKQSNKTDGCKICNKPVDNKPKKYNDDRDKFCQPHEDACCGKCNKEINGQSLNVMDKNFHPNCFSCDKCNKKLQPGDQIKKSPITGNPLCGPCGGNGNKNCHDCKKPIVGNSVEAVDRPYHPQCLKCHSCDKVLKDEFQEVDNEPFCTPCSKQLNDVSNGKGGNNGSPFITSGWKDSDRCVGCVKPLHGEVAKIFDTYYHKGCFKCQDPSCGASLITGYFPHDKKPFCRNCSIKIQSASSEVCPKCNKAVLEGAIIKASGKTYHKQCFTCTTCSKVIGDGTALTKFSKPYCKQCFDSAKVVCAKCRNQIVGEVSRVDQKDYCVKCSPGPSTNVTHGEKISVGWTIDKRSGKKTFNN